MFKTTKTPAPPT